MRDPGVRARLATVGTVPSPDTPDHFAAYLRAEYEHWGAVIREKGIKVE
jgi:tripartite-type tricarboxylate transporter receptor subunit TctC